MFSDPAVGRQQCRLFFIAASAMQFETLVEFPFRKKILVPRNNPDGKLL
jgi:hypothetical protein